MLRRRRRPAFKTSLAKMETEKEDREDPIDRWIDR